MGRGRPLTHTRLRLAHARSQARTQPGSWAVKHYPERSEFTWMDLPSIAEHTGTLRRGPQTDRATVDAPLVRLPLLVEAIEPYPTSGSGGKGGGGPARPLTKQLSSFAETYVMPHSHLIYSGTWYTLSLFGAVITYTRFLRGRGGGGAAAAAARKAAAAATQGGGEALAAGTRRGRR
jgi:cytochrome oxidase assembly protein ShyY1